MEIKVLHFIPFLPTDADAASCLDLFLTKMSDEHDVHLATLSPLPEPAQEYKMYCIGNGKKKYGQNGIVNLLALQNRFLNLLYSLMPHIVHVHGSYCYLNSRIQLWSQKRGFPVVFSPYGGMNPGFIDKEYGMHTWKMICYQKNMVRHASCLLTSDAEEKDYIMNEARLTDRIELIRDPREGEYADFDGYAEQVGRLYLKVLDSDKGAHLDQQCLEAVSALLHLSMAGDNERQPLCSQDILNLRSITPAKWRDIYIYAAEQGITSFIKEGGSRAQLTIPDSAHNQARQFATRFKRDLSPLPDDRLIAKSFFAKRAIGKISEANVPVRKICTMLFNLRYHFDHQTVSLRHLCDIYDVFRYVEVDEDRLADALRQCHLLTFARRLCQVLAEVAYLDEGFMPVAALNDRGTERMRATIMKY